MAISFVNQDISFILKQKLLIIKWIKLVAQNNQKKIGNISYAFCSDSYILAANNQYLNHNFFTDIITFDYCENDIIEGDILISIDTVKDNSNSYGVPFEVELHRVIIHGILHLVGFDDKTDTQQKIMRNKEDEALILLTTL